MSLEPKTFEYKGQKYKTYARGRKLLVAVCDIGSCCHKWVFVTPKMILELQGGEEKIRPNAIWEASKIVVNDSLEVVDLGGFKIEGVTVPEFEPETVPGTSEGTQYFTLFATAKGYISHRQNSVLSGKARIRVAKNNQSAPWFNTSLSDSKNWNTIAGTHLAEDSHNSDEAKVLIARGLDELFRLDKI